MPSPKQPNILSGVRPLQDVFRQMIDNSLSILRKDCTDPEGYLVNELFSAYGYDTVKRIKDYLTSHPNIPVVLNWPKDTLGIPQICVVTPNEDEDAGSDFLGDRGHVIGTAAFSYDVDEETGVITELQTAPIVQREQRSYAQTITLQIYVRTEEPNLTMYLSNMVRLIIFMNKDKLTEYSDLHNMTISLADIAHNPELFPEFAYTRQVSIRGLTFFDYNLPPTVLQRFSFELLIVPQIIETSGKPVVRPAPVDVPYSK